KSYKPTPLVFCDHQGKLPFRQLEPCQNRQRLFRLYRSTKIDLPGDLAFRKLIPPLFRLKRAVGLLNRLEIQRQKEWTVALRWSQVRRRAISARKVKVPGTPFSQTHP